MNGVPHTFGLQVAVCGTLKVEVVTGQRADWLTESHQVMQQAIVRH